MNLNIKTLFGIASKSERKIIGLMSGTSLDGLDIAFCNVRKNGIDTEVELLEFETAPYTKDFKRNLLNVFSKADAKLREITMLNVEVALLHAHLVNEALRKWKISNAEVDLIASHGQTIFHAPRSFHQELSRPNATLQIGDGDHIAQHTGIITISDFRQKHVAHGGEGAPLAVYGDYLMFANELEDKVLLNIGGISNFTFLPRASKILNIFTSDIGPGNTLMNQYTWHAFGKEYDRDAARAKNGVLNEHLLEKLLTHPFLKMSFPKSTGPELFTLQYILDTVAQLEQRNLRPEDILHTLCHFTAEVICEAILTTADVGTTICVSGGGIHNPLLWSLLKKGLSNYKVVTTDYLGINADAKEAIIFALLANECVAGKPLNFGSRAMPATTFGKISFPK